MAFEGLSSKLQNIFRKLGGKGKLTEKEVKEAMREIKLALLEADVNFSVVKSFINTVSARAVGSDVLQSLTPSQQIIKIVNEELTQLIGGSVVKVEFGPRKPSVFLLAGLQGAGKTTMAGKLAAYLAKTQGKKPLLVACDIYRPAAITQLQVVGEKVNVPVFERGTQDPVKTAKEAIEYASRNFYDLVIIDTAGRLLVAESGSNAFSSINASPDAFAISITAAVPAVFSPNEVRTPYSAAIFLPSGAVTFTERIFPLKARISVSAVPSPPSAIGSVLTLHPGRYCRAAFLIIVQTRCAPMLPLNLSGAISIRIPAPTGSIRLPPYSSKGFTTGFSVFLQPHSVKSFSLKTRVPFSSNLP